MTPGVRRGGLFALLLVVAACGGSTPSVKGNGAHKDGSVETGTTIVLLPPKRDAGVDAAVIGSDASPREASADVVQRHDAGVDAQPPPPSDAAAHTYPAFLPDAPQVLDYGGPVLTSPLFVPIFFKGDQYQDQVIDFVKAVGSSDYWSQAVGEYAVGAGSMATPIVLDETFPSEMSDRQIQIWLQNRLGSDPRFLAVGSLDAGAADAGHADAGHVDAGRTDAGRTDAGHGSGASDAGQVSLDANAPLSNALSPTAMAPPEALYIILVPEGTKVTEGNLVSCTGFGGYHTSTVYTPNGSPIVYAVIPRCATFNGLSGVNVITGALSHELAEAATDPLPDTNAAYLSVDEEHIFWGYVFLGNFGIAEVGDMCALMPNAYYNPSEAALSSFTVQRIWSNANAKAGHDPCRPALSATEEPFYFNSVPKLGMVTFNVNTAGGEQPITTLGMVAPPNVPTTLELDLFSDAPSEGMDWTVAAFSPYNGGAADLMFSPVKGVMGQNGYKLNLTVTNLSDDGMTVHPFIVQSTIGDLDTEWIGVVSDR